MKNQSWRWGRSEPKPKALIVGSLVEAALHTPKPDIKLIPGRNYTVEEILKGNGVRVKKGFSFKELIA